MPPGTPASTLLLRARSLTGFGELVRTRGGDPDVLLEEAGLTPALLASPDATLPLAAFIRLLALCAQRLQMPDFGVRLAAHQDLTVLGTIALIALNSRTVREAFEGVIRNLPYHSPGLQVSLATMGALCAVRVFHVVTLTLEEHRQLSEHALFNSLNLIRTIAQVQGTGWVVNFDHPGGPERAHYPSLFGASINFDTAQAEVVIPAALLDIPIQAANPALLQSSERYLRSLIRRHPLDLPRQIEELVARQLGTGRCTLPVIAQQLGIPGHTLQRRLADQTVCFEDIVDGLRRQRALDLLPMTAVPLTRVADALGYTSQASFTRSCRRWFGEPPKALRARHAGNMT